MKLVILFGPPGVGKGTQCSLLSSRLGFKHISTGSIIRSEIQSQSKLGLRVKELVESGNLVDDKTIFECLDKALASLDGKQDSTILLDGLPRTLNQAEELEKLIKRLSFDSVQVICLEADVECLVKRFETRFTCSKCSNVETVPFERHNLLTDHVCKSCGSVGTLYRRRDDEPSTVRHRLDLYESETLPIVSFYKDRKIINFVDGLKTPEYVYAKVVSFLI
jgi:adenylate kinase